MPHSENKEDKTDNRNMDTLVNVGLAGAASEVVQRFGSANKEQFVALDGVDRETGQQLAKGLKGIAKAKINPEHRDANIKQQAGFAAEVKVVARENAEKIIKGDDKTKVTRTDDMKIQSAGKDGAIGGKNDQLFDIAEIDKNGIYVEGTARQLKFVGGTPEKCAENLLLGKYDKYRDADATIEIPSDFYDGVKSKLEAKAQKIKKQIETAEKRGNPDIAAKKKAELEKIEKTSKNLKKSNLTKDEAIEARLHPKISTAKDVAKISIRGGLEAAKSGAAIGGGISFIRNAVAVIKGDKETHEAAADIAKDTAVASSLSFATGAAGSALKGGMQNVNSEFVRSLSKTNLPGVIVATTLETGRVLKRYADGEIDGTECLIELGEKGTGMLASGFGATVGVGVLKSMAVGQTLIPIPIVGGLIGGMIGYSLSSAYYNDLVNALKDAKLAREERLRIEAECQEAVLAINEYRIQMELVISNYLQEHKQAFNKAFAEMKTAYNTQDVDGFISGANLITKQLGGKPLFETKQEFDNIMSKKEAIKI